MHLKLITHDRIVFDEDVNEIYTRGVDGEFGILENYLLLWVVFSNLKIMMLLS